MGHNIRVIGNNLNFFISYFRFANHLVHYSMGILQNFTFAVPNFFLVCANIFIIFKYERFPFCNITLNISIPIGLKKLLYFCFCFFAQSHGLWFTGKLIKKVVPSFSLVFRDRFPPCPLVMMS